MSGELQRRDDHGLADRPLPRQGSQPAGQMFHRPDFVLSGSHRPDGRVWLLASRDLLDSELNADYDWRGIDDGFSVFPLLTGYRIKLSTRMTTFTIVEADDYARAMAEVDRKWREGR